MDKEQNSVEWLTQQVLHLDWQFLTQEKKRNICEQAKAMHQKEHIKTWNVNRYSSFEEYYEKTFNK